MELETTAWYALGVPALIAVVLWELRQEKKRQLDNFSFAEALSNVSAGLGTLLVGLFLGPYLIHMWDVVVEMTPISWGAFAWWHVPAALLLSDFCYYIYHRAGHAFGATWAIHGIHHQHEKLNSTVGLRLEFLADPMSAAVFVLMPLLGCTSTVGYLAIAILSAYTLTAHSPAMDRPSFGVFVTPAIHGGHHSRDARFVGKNFGAMFSIWDRLFGTYLELPRGEPLRVDVPSISRMHDGVSTQWVLVVELWRAVRSAPGLRNKMRLIFGPPDEAGGGPHPESGRRPLRSDDTLGQRMRELALGEYGAILAFAMWLLWLRTDHTLVVKIFGVLLCVWGLHAIGAVLDGRPSLVKEQRLWLGAATIGACALVVVDPVVAALALAGCLLGWFLLVRSAEQPMPARARVLPSR